MWRRSRGLPPTRRGGHSPTAVEASETDAAAGVVTVARRRWRPRNRDNPRYRRPRRRATKRFLRTQNPLPRTGPPHRPSLPHRAFRCPAPSPTTMRLLPPYSSAAVDDALGVAVGCGGGATAASAAVRALHSASALVARCRKRGLPLKRVSPPRDQHGRRSRRCEGGGRGCAAAGRPRNRSHSRRCASRRRANQHPPALPGTPRPPKNKGRPRRRPAPPPMMISFPPPPGRAAAKNALGVRSCGVTDAVHMRRVVVVVADDRAPLWIINRTLFERQLQLVTRRRIQMKIN